MTRWVFPGGGEAKPTTPWRDYSDRCSWWGFGCMLMKPLLSRRDRKALQDSINVSPGERTAILPFEVD